MHYWRVFHGLARWWVLLYGETRCSRCLLTGSCSGGSSVCHPWIATVSVHQRPSNASRYGWKVCLERMDRLHVELWRNSGPLCCRMVGCQQKQQNGSSSRDLVKEGGEYACCADSRCRWHTRNWLGGCWRQLVLVRGYIRWRYIRIDVIGIMSLAFTDSTWVSCLLLLQGAWLLCEPIYSLDKGLAGYTELWNIVLFLAPQLECMLWRMDEANPSITMSLITYFSYKVWHHSILFHSALAYLVGDLLTK